MNNPSAKAQQALEKIQIAQELRRKASDLLAEASLRMSEAETLLQEEQGTSLAAHVRDELSLPIRAHHCLAAENIHTLADLVNCSRRDLLKIPNLGQATIRDIESSLAERGLKLRAAPLHSR